MKFLTHLSPSYSGIISVKQDRALDYSRYGWMTVSDIEISNAIVLPKGFARDPFDTEHSSTGGSAGSGTGGVAGTGIEAPTIDLVMTGIALGAVAVLVIVICLYIRLRREHAALEKDKLTGGSLRRMWDKFMTMQSGGGGSSSGSGGADGRNYAYKHLNMQEFSTAVESGQLSADDDNQLDLEDESANRR